MSENGQPRNILPVLPWEIVVRSFGFDFEPQPDGTMVLVIFPAMEAPGASALVPPAVKIPFSPEGWQKFKRRVALDGRPVPDVAVARVVPPHP